ncbi:MAG: hypothetical protein V4447_12660, partial [Pseudomonadota bacterium]
HTPSGLQRSESGLMGNVGLSSVTIVFVRYFYSPLFISANRQNGTIGAKSIPNGRIEIAIFQC